MLIDWPLFLAALALLLVPAAVFHHRQVRFRHLDRDWHGYLPRALSLGTHYIDAGRAALGGILLLDALSVPAGAAGSTTISVFAVQAAVLGLGTILQTFVCRESGTAHAPLAYVSGLALGFLPLVPAAFSVVFAVAVAAGTRQVVGYFPVLAVALVLSVVGFYGKRYQYQLIAGASAVALPWLLTLLFPRPLVATHVARRVAAPPDPKR